MTDQTTALTYLSPQWLAEANRAAATANVDAGTNVEVTITATDVSAAAPALGTDTITYALVVAAGQLQILDSQTPTSGGPSMTMSYLTAASIAQGQTSAQRAFLDGEISLGGDLDQLIESTTVKAMTAASDCFAGLRDRTTFPH